MSSSHGWIGRAGETLCIIPLINYLIFTHSSAVTWEFTMYISSIQDTSSISDSVANPWEWQQWLWEEADLMTAWRTDIWKRKRQWRSWPSYNHILGNWLTYAFTCELCRSGVQVGCTTFVPLLSPHFVPWVPLPPPTSSLSASSTIIHYKKAKTPMDFTLF